MKKINCDVVVVGAGPGGSMAAKTCAKYGLDTVLVERKEKLRGVKNAKAY
jgi:digeranylgeranylglycerophospholipid reductase